MEFRDLMAEEIECRIGTLKSNGLSLLLYKNARVDMDVLDETLGSENWQRDHKAIKDNMYCGVSIWDDEKKQWITKWDAGKESYTEAEKGEASDSFKRACVNWGIGRELYTSPFIWIPSAKCNIEDTGKTDSYGKHIYKCTDRFNVIDIEITDKKITKLEILNETTGVQVFYWDIDKQAKIEPIIDKKLNDTECERLYNVLKAKGLDDETITKTLKKGYGVNDIHELTITQYTEILNNIKGE